MQIPLMEDSARYIKFTTPFGCYYLCFCPRTLPKQDGVMKGLQRVVCHMDKHGLGANENDTRLHTVLGRIQKAGITLNLEKCDLSK